MRIVLSVVVCAALAVGAAGCNSLQPGPTRPITIDDDVARVRVLAEPELGSFYSMDAATQAVVRNQILTARMYIADMEYHYYETRLTRDMQEEGFAATVASLALTTSAALIPVVQTKTLLAGIATGVIGADKAVTEKILLSNTIQALQTQMRTDRKTEAGVIYAKMFKTNGRVTPIAEYTLAMALSDADAYYQAGTISSALIGLSKTVANAERNADQAKSDAGPNPGAVSDVKATAAPQAGPQVSRRPTVIRDASAPLQRVVVPPPPRTTAIGPFETRMSQKDMKTALDILGCPGTDLGPAGSQSRKALAKFLADNGKPSSDRLTDDVFFDLREIKAAGKQGSCSD
jgi:hypothetical protein